jgi:hypothetical protein
MKHMSGGEGVGVANLLVSRDEKCVDRSDYG